MPDWFRSLGRRIWREVDRWFRSRADECRHCRECNCEISPLDDVCPHCGAYRPAKISYSAAAVVVVLGVTGLLIVVLLF